MKKITFLFSSLLCIALFVSCSNSNASEGEKSVLDTANSKAENAPAGNFNYALGLLVGQNIAANLGLKLTDFNLEEMTSALVSVLEGKISPKELQTISMQFNTEAQTLVQNTKNGSKTPVKLNPKFSYNCGVTYGKGLSANGLTVSDFNAADFTKGFKHGFGDGAPEMDAQTAQGVVQAESQKFMAKIGEKNTAAGKAFMAENLKKNPAIKTTASGIQYEILKPGLPNGPKPTINDQVTTHYHGTNIDGSVFDSSVDRKDPASFPLNGVIKGWQEILQMMPKGAKWRVTIPSELAYGPQGSPGGIAPNATLVFEIELLKINGK